MDGREEILLFWRKPSPEALVAAAAVFVHPAALISVGNRLGPSDVERDHLAVSTDCTQRSPTKMETISAESRPARGGEGVSRHPGFMSPITQNGGISMNNAAAPAASCAGLECDVHKRHKRRKGKGCSERWKPGAGFKKKYLKNEKQQLQQQVRNWFFQTSFLPFTSALFLFFYAVYSRACVCTAVFSPRAPPVAAQGCSYSAESFARVFKTRVAIYGRINKAPALAVPRLRSLISKPGGGVGRQPSPRPLVDEWRPV